MTYSRLFTFLILMTSEGLASEVPVLDSCDQSSDAMVYGSYANQGRQKLSCSVRVNARFRLKSRPEISKQLFRDSNCIIPMDTTMQLCFDFSEELPYENERGEILTDGNGWTLVSDPQPPVTFNCSPVISGANH